ncbi:MAG: ferritin [Chloroflexota bacterium]|nr:MAG: ferritin [Chloroflexota bacterium]
MLISKELELAINEQIGREFSASLQYINIATFFDSDALPQLAAFFYRQSDEERMHAMKFVHYLVETGGEIRIPALPQPKADFVSTETAVQLALDWENEVTRQINALMDLAIEQNDHLAQDFLRWFIREQLEEVSSMTTLLHTVRRSKDNLLMVEDFLARNPIVPEA